MTNDLKNFLEVRYASVLKGEVLYTKESDRTLINFVLDLVEKEVENYFKGLIHIPNPQLTKEKLISTIINNLRV